MQELNDRHLTLMEGSVFAEGDLERARACDAAAALVLADRFTSNAAQEDTDVQFRVWALKSYTKKVPLYVQVGAMSCLYVASAPRLEHMLLLARQLPPDSQCHSLSYTYMLCFNQLPVLPGTQPYLHPERTCRV